MYSLFIPGKERNILGQGTLSNPFRGMQLTVVRKVSFNCNTIYSHVHKNQSTN